MNSKFKGGLCPMHPPPRSLLFTRWSTHTLPPPPQKYPSCAPEPNPQFIVSYNLNQQPYTDICYISFKRESVLLSYFGRDCEYSCSTREGGRFDHEPLYIYSGAQVVYNFYSEPLGSYSEPRNLVPNQAIFSQQF